MKRRSTAGYTIMEVMIVLAVTGALFVSVVLMMGGRQAATGFTQAVKDYESKIQSVVSDVANGYYQSGAYGCSAGDAPLTPVTIDPTPSVAGTNKGCVFVGKVFATGPNDADVLTLIGRQYKGSDGSGDVENLTDAVPIPVASVSETYTYKLGLQMEAVYINGTTTVVSGFGFITQLAGAGAVGTPVTGSRGVLLYRLLAGTFLAIGASNATKLVQTNEGIRICVSDGGRRRAEITIGADASQTTTFVAEGPLISTECLNA